MTFRDRCRVSHEKIKRQGRRYVVLELSVVVFIWWELFVPLEISEPILTVLAQAGESIRDVWGVSFLTKSLAGLTGSAIVAWLSLRFLRVADPMYNAADRSVTWFRARYPILRVPASQEWSNKDQDRIWFLFFDYCGHARSGYQHLVRMNYRATYHARVVWLLKRMIPVLYALTIVLISANLWGLLPYVSGEPKLANILWHRLIPHAFGIIIMLFFALWLYRGNRVPRTNQQPSGCWAAVDRIFGRLAGALEGVVGQGRLAPEEARMRIESWASKFSKSDASGQ